MVSLTFCEQNFNHGTNEVFEKLKNEYPDTDINVNPCVRYCGECSDGPFALIDSEVISEETPDQLYETIVKRLG